MESTTTKGNALQRVLGDTKWVVHVLVCVFAVSSWLDINGLWVELPILVTNLPEQWTLPSYIIALSQLANLGPIAFFVLANCVRKTRAYKSTLDKVTAYVIMVLGFVSTFLLAFVWKCTAHVAGSERSVAVLALSFSLALTDCTSSLAYTAYMATLKPHYMPTFFLGEGLSGLLPALMALGQGAGEIVCVNSTYTRQTFVNGAGPNVTIGDGTNVTVINGIGPNGTRSDEEYVTMVDGSGNGTVVNVTGFSVFPVYLPPRFSLQPSSHKSRHASAERQEQQRSRSAGQGRATSPKAFAAREDASHSSARCLETRKEKAVDFDPDSAEDPKYVPVDQTPMSDGRGSSADADDRTSPDSPVFAGGPGRVKLIDDCVCEDWEGDGAVEVVERRVSRAEVVFLLLQVVLVNFLITSFLLTIQVYSSLPYGIHIYNLVVTLSNIANPVACVISIVLTVRSRNVIISMTSLGVACSVYVIVAAAMSPTPPMVETAAGGIVAVVIWVGASFFLTFAKISIGSVLRHVGRRALIWYGVATQGGALIGALTGFLLVTEFRVFKDAPWC
ncbi:hypothetical protein BaRGS_00023279 [Batillaria attramentaria]|uniref:Riboflavin transporter n=1 Tax=Batillaria attramentaria TaxID=370345 RepID=A0ABD0KEB6_9CAEN